jgi:hypothetical protein
MPFLARPLRLVASAIANLDANLGSSVKSFLFLLRPRLSGRHSPLHRIWPVLFLVRFLPALQFTGRCLSVLLLFRSLFRDSLLLPGHLNIQRYILVLLIQFAPDLLPRKPSLSLGLVLRKFRRILLRSILALQSFRLPGTVVLLLLILPTEVEMMMTTAAAMILLIHQDLPGPVLKAHPGRPVLPVMVKAPRAVVEVVEVAAVAVMAVPQDHLANRQVQIPTSVFSFRPFPRSGMPSTSGIDKPRLLVLPSRISGIWTPLTVPIQPNSTRSSPSATFISPNARRIFPPMTIKFFS